MITASLLAVALLAAAPVVSSPAAGACGASARCRERPPASPSIEVGGSAPDTPESTSAPAACRERRTRAPAAKSERAALPLADLDDFTASVRRFEEEAQALRREVEDLVRMRHDERRRAVADQYEAGLSELEAQERRERVEAIAQFEEFVARYPEDPAYTADAMFRLAELHYEKANDDYEAELAAWREEVRRALADGREPPPEPGKSYAKAIGVYQRLLTGFPGYRNLHAVQYLLAYCLGEMGQAEEAQRAYADLVERYPESPYVQEAWVRIGDFAFDDVRPGALERAVDAFSKLEARPDHRLYPRALYKLGWTFYRLDEHDRAVQAFAKLLDFYAAQAATGAAPVGDVWPEAVQYTAISFSDETWGGVEKAKAFFARLGGRPYEAEIYRRLGDVLFDQGRYAEAVKAYALVLERAPLAPDAPRMKARIALAWSKDGRFDEEAKAREELVATYDEKGAWWQRHRGDPELTREVRDLSERSLVHAATYHHQQAQLHKQAGRKEQAVAEYRAAARVYGQYLERFPHAKNAYELAYQWADCLYDAGQLVEAAKVYARVRDDPADRRLQGDAALAAVLSWQRSVGEAQAAGRLEERRPLTSKERAGEPPRPEPLPPLLAGLVEDSDALVDRLPAHEKAAAAAYKAGEVYYAYNDFAEARCRLEEVVARWPASDVAQYAANLIIESHLAVKDWAAVEAASARLQNAEAAKNRGLAETLQKFKLGGRFNRAMQLMERKEWDEAARLFVALVAEDPKHEFADKALYNAAACHEGARRFESALALQERIHAEYPNSAFADEALFRVAWNAENTYDFEKAVARYLLLVDKYPGSKQRKDALYNAARSLENLQSYDAAASAYARYAALYPDAEDAARTQFHAALVYEKKKEWRREVLAMQDFVRRFSRSKEHELVVQAHLKLALAERELGDDRAARAGYEQAVAEFARRKLEPDKAPLAAAAAAEARFRLAEYDFERFDAIRLPATANAKKLRKALDAKMAELKQVAPQYNEVKKYRRPDWILAAFYRQAYLLERLAQTLYEAPIPPELQQRGQEEFLAAYQDQLSQFAQPYEDQAVQIYAQAIQAARELHVKNDWTRKISESLARYRPKEYPILKDAKGRMMPEDLSPSPIAEAPEGPIAGGSIDRRLGQAMVKPAGDDK